MRLAQLCSAAGSREIKITGFAQHDIGLLIVDTQFHCGIAQKGDAGLRDADVHGGRELLTDGRGRQGGRRMLVRGVTLDHRHAERRPEARQPIGERRAHDAAADHDHLIAHPDTYPERDRGQSCPTGHAGSISASESRGVDAGEGLDHMYVGSKAKPAASAKWFSPWPHPGLHRPGFGH